MVLDTPPSHSSTKILKLLLKANLSVQTISLCWRPGPTETGSPCFSQASRPAQIQGLNFSRPLLFFTEEWLCNIRLSHTRLSSNQTPQTLPCNRYQATGPALVHQHTEASILLKPSAAHFESPVETSSLAGERFSDVFNTVTHKHVPLFLSFTSIISSHLLLFVCSHLKKVKASIFTSFSLFTEENLSSSFSFFFLHEMHLPVSTHTHVHTPKTAYRVSQITRCYSNSAATHQREKEKGEIRGAGRWADKNEGNWGNKSRDGEG